MKRNLIIYHGSKEIVEKPIFRKGNPKNDYGLGFYCTEEIEIAKEWSVNLNKDGYLNIYELDMTGLTILDLTSDEYNTLHWTNILIQNRTFSIKNDIASEGKKYLNEHFSLDYENFDIIKGYRADDSYFTFAQAFLNNTISCQRLSEALKLGELGEQIVIKSKKAFDHLKFIGQVKAEAGTYYPLRKERIEKARDAFLNDKKGVKLTDALYLSEIIKGGIDENDTRLR